MSSVVPMKPKPKLATSRRARALEKIQETEKALADKTATPGGTMVFSENTSGNPTVGATTTVPAKKKKLKKKKKLIEQLTRFHNREQRAKWAIQYPKRVKPTSNGGHLVLSNHTQREGEKLINAINRRSKHTTMPTATSGNK